MGIKKLNSLFRPQRIALIGVSTSPQSVGGLTLKNLVGGGFRGVVYPVNPKHEAVLGIPCYPNVKSLPKVPDLAVITTAAKLVPQLVKECGEAGINGIIIMSAGFREAGPEGQILEDQVKAEVAKFPDMRVLGPNCLGVIIPALNLNISFASGMPKTGHVAFISQSGALCTSVLDWALEENIGFSNFISIGNIMDVGFGDLIDYFGQDPNTKSIVLYVESVVFGRAFMTAARAFARKKPIIVYKAGRFPESARAAAAHTGAMPSDDSVYDALFLRAGIARVYNLGNIFDFTDLISRKRIPKGPNLAIVSNAGGPGVMATDSLIAQNGHLAELSEQTLERLNEFLPSFWSRGNPVDVIGDATPERMTKAVEIVLEDPQVDAVLVILTPQAMTQPTETAAAIAKFSEHTSKPIMTTWLGGRTMRDGINIFNNTGIPSFHTPEQAIRAFMTLVRYSKNLDALFETPKDIPLSFTYDRQAIREKFVNKIFPKNKVLGESDSKLLINSYGIETTETILAKTVDEAVEVAEKIGYPVVIKIKSPDILHKTDVGGVFLNLGSADIVRASYNTMMSHVASVVPDAKIEGITVQKMIDNKDSVELMFGIKKDPTFGTMVIVGRGGANAELFNDRSLGFPPLSDRLALKMLESLTIYPLLTGYKGGTRKNIDKLIETMIRLSYLAADYPEIEEILINPVIVTKEDVIALDARVIIDPSILGTQIVPFSHLLLHPYPEKFVSKTVLRDGTDAILRPIKPEDEPLWLELLASCSKESIYSRFRYNFHYDSHEIATQFCFIDYAREIAIVAEIEEKGQKKLIGIGRLISDPDMETVEYAILITDAWQHKDLGTILTEYCLNIAKQWNMKKIFAQTTKDNKPMITVFKKLGFKVSFNTDTTVDVNLDLV